MSTTIPVHIAPGVTEIQTKPDLFELVSLSFVVPFSKYLLLIFKHSSLQFYRLEFFLSLIRTDKYLRL